MLNPSRVRSASGLVYIGSQLLLVLGRAVGMISYLLWFLGMGGSVLTIGLFTS